MRKNFMIFTVIAGMLTGVFSLPSHSHASPAVSRIMVEDRLCMRENSKGYLLAQRPQDKKDCWSIRCLECAELRKKAERLVKKTQRVAERAARASEELKDAMEEMRKTGKAAAEERVLAAEKEAQGAMEEAGKVSKEAKELALEAWEARCCDSFEKAQAAAEKVMAAVKQVQESIDSAQTAKRRLQRIFPVRYPDPQTTEQERYRREREVSPSQ